MPHSYDVFVSAYTLDLLLLSTPAPEMTTLLNLQIFFYLQGHVFILSNFLCLSLVNVMGQRKWYIYYILSFILSVDENGIIIIIITFMQGMYNHIPETNHVSRAHSVAAVLYWQSVRHVMLFRPWNVLCVYISTLRSMCAVTNIAVFCSSLIS